MPPKAQQGEGIVVVVDVGPQTRLGLPIEQTFFSHARTCLVNILQRKMFADKCRDQVGVVLFGTDGTENPLAKPGQYQHVTVLQDIHLVNWSSVAAAESLPRGSCSGDWLDALVVAINLLHDQQALFSSKKIVLMTDFSGAFSDNQADAIIGSIKSLGIDLSVIGPELEGDDAGDDEASNGHGPSTGGGMSWSGKPKTVVQLAGEALVANVVNAVDGIICSFEEAIPQLIFFQKKSSGSTNWNTILDIGEDFKIPVTGRIKMKRATVNTWSRCHATDEAAVILKERSYHKQDDQQTLVDDEDVIDGYRYGTTLVPFSEEDRQMSYNSGAESAQLSVLGFTRSEHCSLPLRAGDQVLFVTARDGDEEAAVALSSVIRALAELDMVGISRRVYRRGLTPVLGALFPHITPDYECLVWVPLPYQEDVRALSFPSLRRYTDAITQQQTDAMDALIDAMNLCLDDGEELLDPETVLNPQLQHYYNCLTDRAVNLGRPLPAPHLHVLNLLSVPEEVHEAQERLADRLVSAFPTTKIVRRVKRERENIFDDAEGNSSKRSREDDNSDDGAEDASELSVAARVTRVTTATPLQDFTAMLQQQPHNFLHICQELSEVLLQLVETLSPDTATSPAEQATADKIFNCLEAYRTKSVVIEPEAYNKLVQRLKELVVGRGLGESLWPQVRERTLGLITKTDTLKSTVTADEAEQFLKVEAPRQDEVVAAPPQHNDQDYDDLLDDL